MSQSRNKKIGELSQSGQAQWDSQLTKAFVDVCVERVKAGDRPYTHFTRKGWKRVINDFKEKTGRSYSQLQLKNKWDNLRKEWKLWEKLLLDETSYEWDTVRNTIAQDNDWWERKIKEDKRCAKYRNRGIDNREGLETLFRGLVATGQHAMIPSEDESNDNPGIDDQGGQNTKNPTELLSIPTSSDPDYQQQDDHHSLSSPTAIENRRRRSFASASRRRRVRNKRNQASDQLSHSVNQNVSIVQNRQRSYLQEASYGSMKVVMEKLKSIPEVVNNRPLRGFTLQLMEKEHNRKFFLDIEPNDWALDWLEGKFEEYKAMGSSYIW